MEFSRGGTNPEDSGDANWGSIRGSELNRCPRCPVDSVVQLSGQLMLIRMGGVPNQFVADNNSSVKEVMRKFSLCGGPRGDKCGIK